MKNNGRDRKGSGKKRDERKSSTPEGGRGRIKADKPFERRDDERRTGKSDERGERRYDDRKSHSDKDRGERKYGSRDERSSREQNSDRPFRDRSDSGEKKFKREERPFKAGTKPAGRRAREEGEKRPRTTTDSQRDYIKKERSFDRQDRPYKAGTRPAGREEDESGERKDWIKKDRSFKKQDRPYKAGSRPPARRTRQEGEKRPGTTSEFQRDYIKKDRSFDRQDRPYKAGTQPAGREGDDSDERKDWVKKDRTFKKEDRPYKAGTRPAGRYRSGERDGDRRGSGGERSFNKRDKYGDRKNYREKSFDRNSKFERPAKKDDDGKIRLNKYIANSGICSRREADEYIAAGVVSVNGKIITEMGYKVSPGDEVKFHDKKLRSEKMVYVLLNKPKDFITTTEDDRDRKTVMNLVKDAGRERIYPVGRLDRATTGVLLLTNDGDLTKKLTHPSHEIKKIYQVELDKSLKPSDLDQIKNGVELEDGVAEVDEIIYSGDSKKVLGIELHSGKNRIVRRIFESLDYRVVKLDRVYFAGLTKKDLQRGRWRFLTEMEVNMLKMLTAKKPKRLSEKFE